MALSVRLNFFKSITRICSVDAIRSYSVFPSEYVKPVYTKHDQDDIDASGEAKRLAHIPIKPAFTDQTCSEFHDITINKFINFIMRKGKKDLARSLLDKTFENIKRIQITKYHKAALQDRDIIELDPKNILYKAIENSCPVLDLMAMQRGGITYQVPIPVSQKRSTFLGMNWLIRAAKEKNQKEHFPEHLARELIDASNNVGKVIRRKQELYKQCEANRSYAHFRWS